MDSSDWFQLLYFVITSEIPELILSAMTELMEFFI